MELTVLSQQGQSAGRTVTLADSVWAIEPHVHAMWHDVKRILANKRQGTHKTKERSEVHGTNKKPYRQKGTGNARQGDVKSPLWRHGGTVFGPRPRDYSMKINRKVSALARRSALSAKVREQNITVVEAFSVQEPRTKDVVKVLKALKLEGKRVLLVTPAVDKTLYLASRNIPGVSILPASDLNTYDILPAHQLLILDKAVDVVNQQLA
jgi:large subunit ribosomal protein L4